MHSASKSCAGPHGAGAARVENGHRPTAKAVVANLVLTTGCLVVVITGVWLEPDPRGYGTHEKLGLPPCPVPKLIGYPCPTCGFTTALARTARLQLGDAFSANPFGAMVFVAACGFLLWRVVATATGQWLLPLGFLKSPWCWGVLVAIYFASWMFKIVAVATGLQTME